MRSIIMCTAFLAVICLLGTPTKAHALWGLFENQYSVVFEKIPALADDNIYKNEIIIGTIAGKKALGKGLILTINIEDAYVADMLDTTVFVAKDGKLMYATLDQDGTPLPERANVLGFADSFQLNLFKARLVMQDIGSILQKSADEIIKSLENFK